MKNKNKYLTPRYDSLRPQWQKFVTKYCERFVKSEAARYAGYAKSNLDYHAKRLLEDETVQLAIKELMQVAQAECEESKSAIIKHLQAQSVVTMEHLCDWDDKKRKWLVKNPNDVLDEFRGCMGMITVGREHQASLSVGTQMAAVRELAKYMKWEQEKLNAVQPLQFNFSGIKDKAYEMNK
jgi:hypothetical protein